MSRPVLLSDISALRQFSAPGARAVVMTMGALHAGHASLFSEAREQVGPDGQVLATIFVNPMQFGEGEDLDRYPRTLLADLDLCAEHGVDAVFAPTISEIYDDQAETITVDPGELGAQWEGEVRPGHFRGVLTIVLKLLNLTEPEVAVFGEKDYQQLVLIRRMAESLNLSARIHGAATVREHEGGLALSSRNVFLSSRDRSMAAAIPAALADGRSLASRGATSAEMVERVESRLTDVGISPDYVVVCAPDLGPPPLAGPARLLVAAYVGSVHLLDNIAVDFPDRSGGQQ
jgi:pantoate--beta-alanine ligase